MATDGNETNKSDTNTSMSENEIKHWLDAYDKVYKHYEIVCDHYFRRTQIIMIAIQGVLFTGFVKLASDIPPLCPQRLVFLLSIPVIGLFFAFAWILSIKRQWNTLELCRCYMRYIEKKLLNYNVPLAIFNAESVIFYLNYSINFIGDPNNRNSSDSNVGDNSKGKSCLQTIFPYECKSGLMVIEKDIACFIRLIWIACFISILCIYWKYWKNLNILPCGTEFVFILASVIVFIYWKSSKGLWEKSKEERENQKNKNNGLLFSIDLKFQSDLDKCNISPELKERFKNEKIKLSGKARISNEKESNKWIIIDKNRKYIIKKEEEKLNVYIYIINFWDLKKDSF